VRANPQPYGSKDAPLLHTTTINKGRTFSKFLGPGWIAVAPGQASRSRGSVLLRRSGREQLMNQNTTPDG